MDPYDKYFDNLNIDSLSLSVWELGKVPFAKLFPDARIFDSNQWVHNHLPFH